MSGNKHQRSIAELHQRVESLRQSVGEFENAPPRDDLCETLEALMSALEELQVTEEELRRQNEELIETRQIAETERLRYLDLFEFAPEAYLVTDMNGIVEACNRAAGALLGVEPGQSVGWPLARFVKEDEKAIFFAALVRLHNSDSVRGWEVGIQPRKSGPLATLVDVVATRDPKGARTGLRWSFRDISERKRGEESVRASEQFLKAVLDGLPANIAILDAAGTIVAVNAAWLKFGQTHGLDTACAGPGSDYLGVCESSRGTDADLARAAAQGIRDVLAGRRENFYLEYPCDALRGKHWFALRVAALGKDHRAILAHEDITERMRAQQLARKRGAELAHVARINTLGEMASGLAHELNQPLAAVVNYCDAVLDMLGVDPADSTAISNANRAEIMNAVEQAAAQAHRAGQIIRHLRDFMRKAGPHKTRQDFNAVIREMVDFTFPEVRDKGVRVRLTLSDDLPVAYFDKIQIEQVLVNLIHNSMEAMELAGSQQRELQISSIRRDDGKLQLTLQDTGPGLDADDVRRIFEPFETNKPEGIGMGLSISRSIIEEHGGRLWTEPTPGKGASFHFTLPSSLEDGED